MSVALVHDPDDIDAPARDLMQVALEAEGIANTYWLPLDPDEPANFGTDREPRIVVLLGPLALKLVMKKGGITRVAGTVWQAHGRTVMALMSPAAILKNPKFAEAFKSDVARLGRLVRGEDASPKTRVQLVTNKVQLQILLEKLFSVKHISWDIETAVTPGTPPYIRTNFQEWWEDDSQIASVSFTWQEGHAVVVPLWHPAAPWKNPQRVLDLLVPVMTRPDTVYIGHNGKFDARWFHAKGVHVPQTFDTMLAAHMLDENRPKGLKSLAHTLLGVDAYSIGEELKDARQVPIKRLALYNGRDTDYTYRLYNRFKSELAEEPRIEAVFRKLMMPASEALVTIERTGVYVDRERWTERHDQAVVNRDKLFEYVQRFRPDGTPPVNLNSPQQVGKLLFGHLGLPIIEETRTGAASTAESVLLRLAAKHKVPLAMIKYRKWAKYLNTYLLPWWFEHMDGDGRIHSNYKLFGTVTGRLSGEGGIQQVPRDPFIRSIIGATPGWRFVQADYSQVELRIAAMLANETRMLRQYAAGEDIHMIRACRMTGKTPVEVTKEERKKAKSVNFGFIYGMGAPKFVSYAFDNYGLVVSEEEAQSVRDGFFDDYPALRPWHERQRRLANRYRRVSSPIGRVRHLPDILSTDRGVKGEAERQAINSPVQSFASDLMLIALCVLSKKLPPTEARIIGTVHDSILFEIKDGYEGEWLPVIKSTMENMRRVKKMFNTEVTVPIVADIEIGTHWGETKPVTV